MNNIQQSARVGLFFLLGLALTWVTFETLSGGKGFKEDGYVIVAGFESLKELKEGDQVTVYAFIASNGAPVGNLQRIVLPDGKELTAR